MTEAPYTLPPVGDGWAVPASGAARFSWDYDEGRARLLSLYQKGKDKQWDSVARIDWDIEVDPFDALGTPEQSLSIYGSDQWNKLGPQDKRELRRHMASWEFSQFLHGEQGAMICSARIVESVPDLDSKFYASTQVMDEARHAEIFSKFLLEKLQMAYPINTSLQGLLDDALSDSRWDFPYLGMQVLIEGLALAAFGVLRDRTTKPLPKQILAYIMQDEARHVAFGRLALKDYYSQLTQAELAEREEFVVEGCKAMRDRFRMQEVWENLGYDVDECLEYMDKGPRQRAFRSLLFTRIVPCVRDIGLWSPTVQKAYDDMGVLQMSSGDLTAMLEADEATADQIDLEKRELKARTAEIDATVAAGTE